MQIITAITVDTSKRGVPPRIFAKQGDQKTRVLHITVTDGDALYRPEPGITAVLRCLRPDGYRLESACTILDDGRFQAILPPQALEAAGALQADLALSNDQGQLLSTVVFCVLVEPSPIEGQSVPTEQSPAQPSVQPATTRSAGQAIPPTISVVDDDCGKEIFTVLYPWMQNGSNVRIVGEGAKGAVVLAADVTDVQLEPVTRFLTAEGKVFDIGNRRAFDVGEAGTDTLSFWVENAGKVPFTTVFVTGTEACTLIEDGKKPKTLVKQADKPHPWYAGSSHVHLPGQLTRFDLKLDRTKKGAKVGVAFFNSTGLKFKVSQNHLEK